MKQIIIIAIASALGGLLLGACIFRKAEGGPSPVQLLQLLAQATNCWVSSGGNVTTSCNVGVGGATPDANTKLAVNGRISSSVLGVYCGKTATTFTGNIGGYAAAKSQCETVCSNANAHMCTGHEISISRQLSLSVSNSLWYDSGTIADLAGGSTNLADCIGWSANGAGASGTTTGNGPGADTCNNSHAIACCL